MPSSEALPEPRRTLPGLALAALIAACALYSVLVVAQRYWLDDAFISFRYARNLIEGHGLVYNPGDPVEGYTNFLWTLVAALGMKLGASAIHFTQAVSVLAQALTLWALWRIGCSAGHRGTRSLLAPLFLATTLGFLAYPMTGMETSAFTALVTLSFLLLRERVHATLGGGILLGLVLLATGITRFDGFGLVILLVSYPLFFEPERKRLVVPLGVFVLGLAVYNLWRYRYYGQPLPNTFYAKSGGFTLERMGHGLAYLQSWAVKPASVLVLALALVPFALGRASTTARHLGWILFGQACYITLVAGDWMPHFRFVFHVLPLLLALMQEGWLTLADGVRERLPAPRFAAAATVALLLAVHARPLARGIDLIDVTGPHFHLRDAQRIGRYLDEHYDPDALISIEWGGIIPFYAHQRVLDGYGLTDRAMVQVEQLTKNVYGTKAGPPYIASRGPDLIAPNARLMPTEAAAWESLRPAGPGRPEKGPNRYSFYHLFADPEMGLGYEWKLFRIADDAWWPALVRQDRAER